MLISGPLYTPSCELSDTPGPRKASLILLKASAVRADGVSGFQRKRPTMFFAGFVIP